MQPLLSRQQQQEIEQALMAARFAEMHGIESRLAERYHVPSGTVHQIKQRLYGQRLFYSQPYRGFLGRTSAGRLFLVERGAWQESVEDGIRVDHGSREESEEINLDPTNWEPCIGGNPGVYLHTRRTNRARATREPLPLRARHTVESSCG
jgi:hypothetical protein